MMMISLKISVFLFLIINILECEDTLTTTENSFVTQTNVRDPETTLMTSTDVWSTIPVLTTEATVIAKTTKSPNIELIMKIQEEEDRLKFTLESKNHRSECLYYFSYEDDDKSKRNETITFDGTTKKTSSSSKSDETYQSEKSITGLTPNKEYTFTFSCSCESTPVTTKKKKKSLTVSLELRDISTTSISVGLKEIPNYSGNKCIFTITNANTSSSRNFTNSNSTEKYTNLDTNANYQFHVSSSCMENDVSDKFRTASAEFTVTITKVTPIFLMFKIESNDTTNYCKNDLIQADKSKEFSNPNSESKESELKFDGLSPNTDYTFAFSSNCTEKSFTVSNKTTTYLYSIEILLKTLNSVKFKVSSENTGSDDCTVNISFNNSKTDSYDHKKEKFDQSITISDLGINNIYEIKVEPKCGSSTSKNVKTNSLLITTEFNNINHDSATLKIKESLTNSKCQFFISLNSEFETETTTTSIKAKEITGLEIAITSLLSATKYKVDLASSCLAQIYSTNLSTLSNAPYEIKVIEESCDSIFINWSYSEPISPMRGVRQFVEAETTESSNNQIKFKVNIEIGTNPCFSYLGNIDPETNYKVSVCSVFDGRSNCIISSIRILVKVPTHPERLTYTSNLHLIKNIILPKVSKYHGNITYCVLLLLGRINSAKLDDATIFNLKENGGSLGVSVIFYHRLDAEKCMKPRSTIAIPSSTQMMSIVSVEHYACISENSCLRSVNEKVEIFQENSFITMTYFVLTGIVIIFVIKILKETTFKNSKESLSSPSINLSEFFSSSIIQITNNIQSKTNDYCIASQVKSNFVSEMSCLIPSIFPQYVINEKSKIYNEFKNLPNLDSETCCIANSLTNTKKNRYKNILPSDNHRVILTSFDYREPDANDYINASWIAGVNGDETYIACQGPMANTVDDFWLMVWEKNVSSIIMLTGLTEENKVKCDLYWPTNKSGSKLKHGIEVKLMNVFYSGELIQSHFTIIRKGYEETKSVCHFHYLAWRDGCVPDSIDSFMCLRHQVKSWMKQFGHKWPIVVHCSAGVGRTGTYLTIDHLLNLLENNPSSILSIEQFVRSMRNRRSLMVQTADQYMYIYKLVAHYVQYPYSSTCFIQSIRSEGEKINVIISESKHRVTNLMEEVRSFRTSGTFIQNSTICFVSQKQKINLEMMVIDPKMQFCNFVFLDAYATVDDLMKVGGLDEILQNYINFELINTNDQKLILETQCTLTKNHSSAFLRGTFIQVSTKAAVQFRIFLLPYILDQNNMNAVAENIGIIENIMGTGDQPHERIVLKSRCTDASCAIVNGLLIVNELIKYQLPVQIGFVLEKMAKLSPLTLRSEDEMSTFFRLCYYLSQ